MIPFGDFTYFVVLAGILLAAIVLGILRVPPSWLVIVTTLLMLVLQYGLVFTGGWPARAAGIGRLVGFALFEWLLAVTLLRVRPPGRTPAGYGRAYYWAAVVLSLLPLLTVKILPFKAGAIAFLGISYATFRGLDVIFGIHDGVITRLSAPAFFAYLLFFPSISSGPIDRYRRFESDFAAFRSRSQVLQDCDAGVRRIFLGLFYKFVLAALVSQYWLEPAARHYGARAVVSYMYAYSAFLFLDFAGYSALAIGTGYFLGIRMPENFNRPFLALNIADFWNRWHITLSTWFRDHVYRRFTIAATRGKWFENRYLASYLGFALTFTLMGLWHGLAWNYVAYGAFHACLLIGHTALNKPGRARRRWPKVIQLGITFHLVCFGFLIFSGRLFR